jgi:Kae1-associated kinase Bud32
MIALAGYMSDLTTDESVEFQQMDRVDSRKSNWIGSRKLAPKAMVGGESVVEQSTFQGMNCVVKRRRGGEYRNSKINEFINGQRIKREVRILHSLKAVRIPCPEALYVNLKDSTIILNKLEGKVLSQLTSEIDFDEVVEKVGRHVAVMHDEGISHGDLNLGNILVGDEVYLIDPSMGELDSELEPLGVDIHLMKESLKALGKEKSYNSFLRGYKKSSRYAEVLRKVREIEARRRYA